MIKDESLFIAIDKEYTVTKINANSCKRSMEGRGTIEMRTEDSKVVCGKFDYQMHYLYLIKLKIWSKCQHL